MDNFQAAIKEFPTHPISADLLDTITWDGLINNLRLAFVAGAEFKEKSKSIEFHDWCSRNGWMGNTKRINQDQSDYATTEFIFKLFKDSQK